MHRTHASGFRLSPPSRRVALFGLLAFFGVGLPRLFTNTTALTLFLQHWDATALPLTYIGAALAVPLLGVTLMWLERRVGFVRLLPALVVVDIVVLVGLRAAVEGAWAAPASMLLAVWVEVEWALVSLVLWGLAERVFRLREAKRSFGLLGAGEPLAALLGGLAVPLLLRGVAVPDLLWVSVGSQVLVLVLLAVILAGSRERLAAHEPAGAEGEAPASPSRGSPARRYLVVLMVLVVVAEVLSLVVDNAFFASADGRYPDARALAEFIGVFFAVVGIFSLFGNLLVCGWLLERFGVLAGLMLLPALVLAGVGVGVAAGGALLFWSVALTKLIEEAVRTGVYRPTFLVLLQALPAGGRTRAQLLAEGVFEPLAAAIAGAALLAIAAWAGVGVAGLMVFAGLLALAWGLLCSEVYRRYLQTLREAVTRRRLELDGSSPDWRSIRRVLLRALAGGRPTDAVFAVHMLARSGRSEAAGLLGGLLAHPSLDVRVSVLAAVEEQRLTLPLARLEERGALPLPVPERCAWLRALAALDCRHAMPRLEAALETSEEQVRAAALVAMLRHCGIEGVLLAGQRMQAMVHAVDARERAGAAQLLGELGVRAFAPSLAVLLRDGDHGVRRAAVQAAARMSAPLLYAPLLAMLEDPRQAGAAAAALVAAGDDVVPLLLQAWHDARGASRRRRHLLEALGRIGSPAALALPARLMSVDDPWLALRATRHVTRPVAAAEGVLDSALLAAEAAARVCLQRLAPLRALPGEGGRLLCRSLADDLACARERLVRLLAMVYPERVSSRLLHDFVLGDEARRGYVVELLEAALPLRHRAVARLLEDDGADDGPASAEPGAALAALLERQPGISRWSRACARWLLARTPAAPVVPAAGSIDEEELAMMLAVEKVIVLRSVTLFAEVPGEYLWEIAAFTREQEAAAGEVILREGDIGSALYVLVDGEVAVSRGGRRLAVIGERDVFGELAALDPEPRSATVTALVDTRLLVLGQEHLETLMSDNIEVVRGILRTLCGRLRSAIALGEEQRPGSPPGPGGDPDGPVAAA